MDYWWSELVFWSNYFLIWLLENTMSQYEKKNVNIDSLSSYMRNGFYPSRNNGRKAALKYLALRIVLVFVIGSTAYGYMPQKWIFLRILFNFQECTVLTWMFRISRISYKIEYFFKPTYKNSRRFSIRLV